MYKHPDEKPPKTIRYIIDAQQIKLLKPLQKMSPTASDIVMFIKAWTSYTVLLLIHI